jgi:Cu(I)/Ag(I) efflux system membrane fusion protein
MKTKMNLNKRDYKVIGITLFAGLFFGWLFFHGSGTKSKTEQVTEEHAHEKETIWTCSMHPQIRMDKPGKCPICGMDLIPLQENTGSEEATSPDEIQMTDAAMKIADIQTMVAHKAYPHKEVYLLGKVKPDERKIAELTARFGGRIERLFINFTGQNVSKGEKLATIYSPVLLTVQKELLEAMEYKQSNPEFYKAARNKLKLWDLTDGQIDNIEQKGETQSYFDILSPITGTVTQRNVTLGDYVKEGTPLFELIDLTKVWVMLEAYESDLPWVKLGDKVNFTVQSIPGKNFTGRIGFIDPFIDPGTRIANVRVEVRNPGWVLKPDMFTNGLVTSTIAGNKKDLMIPKTAVLWTGKRAIVYVKNPDREQPTFKYREIVLGPSAGDFYVVNEGLNEGEEIAVNGVFKIDAAAQLAGKPSMMNPSFAKATDGKPKGSIRTSKSISGINMGNKPAKENPLNTETQQGTDIKKSNRVYMESKKIEIHPQFKQQLTNVYKAYLPLKNAFVKSDAKEVAETSLKVVKSLNNVNMELLEGQTHMVWMNQLKVLEESLKKMSQNADIAEQREAFTEFNLTFYQSVKDFGLKNVTTYYQYCPMAVEQKGAYWFSDIKEIKNPYFGDAMLTCGETSETLKY